MTASATAPRGMDLRRLGRTHLVVAATLPVILLVVLGGFLLWRAPAVSPTAIGTVAPDFSVTDLDGNSVHLADLRGRPVIVNFWASWCGPCVEEFPLLSEAATRHADEGLVVVGIVWQDRSEAARTFMARNGATWSSAMDPEQQVARDYGILGPPETYFIGRDGTIVARQIGQISASSLDEKLAAIMEE
ncbi:MAG: TlpA family protein disulfide reductase [Chloroflexota bacterium]|nr:TlpA family protein disulfide reductase [Chloroflexota bacterium]